MLRESDHPGSFKHAPDIAGAVRQEERLEPADNSGVMNEQWLAERFSRQVHAKNQDIIYEFTKDPGLLHQYYILRKNLLNESWGVPYVQDLEDAYDAHSHIMVARIGNHVIGGFRLITRMP